MRKAFATTAALLTLLGISLIGSAAATASPTATDAALCKTGYYKNVSGNCIKRPTKAPSRPAGASAKCRDGSYSFSAHRSGTCSHHGGVSIWY